MTIALIVLAAFPFFVATLAIYAARAGVLRLAKPARRPQPKTPPEATP